MKDFSKVITHNGTFHADEVIAIALLGFLEEYDFNIFRSRDKQVIDEALLRDNVIVLDVGFQYDPQMNNFDHHQDLKLHSAAGLIWNEVKSKLFGDDYIAISYFSEFIAAIDMVDVNRSNIYAQLNELPNGFRNVSSLIGAFNRDPSNDNLQSDQFLKALNFANEIIENEIVSAKEKAKAEREYNDREIMTNNVAIFDVFSPIWKEKGEHQFAILPHHSGWQIQTRDSSVAVIPESIKNVPSFIFRHASGFMATAKDRKDLVLFALEEL